MTTVLENIELCDKDCVEVKAVNVAQKIKLRAPSYAQISSGYAEFVENKRASSQDSLASTPDSLASTPEANLPQAVVTEAPVKKKVEIVEVVAINPRVSAMLNLLEIRGEGAIASSSYKALKIKPTMRENMEKNAMPVAETMAEETILPESKTEIIESIAEIAPEVPSAVETIEENDVQEESLDGPKVSKNGATIAKVERYTIAKDENESLDEKVQVSPTVVEEDSSRPVSREVPVVALPRTVSEPKKEFVLAPKPVKEEEKSEQVQEEAKTEIINVSIIDNINNLADLRAYLAETAKIKAAAEKAKSEEEEAKKSAELAEKEAESRRTEMLKTAEKVAAHQEALREQAEKSKEQASMYDAKRGQYENEKSEYQKAIDDMLALMSETSQVDKGKSL